jgi:hypothetical protein
MFGDGESRFRDEGWGGLSEAVGKKPLIFDG